MLVMRIVRILGMLLGLLAALAGCAGADAPTADAPTAATNAPAAIGSTAEVASGPFVVPTPASDQVGVVTGKLFHTREAGGVAPLALAPVYLGNVLKSDTGVEGMVALDKGVAPKAEVDAQGNFAFADVPPGRYGLMLDTPRGAILLNHPDSGNDMIVEVTGGKVVDLGELRYPNDFGY